jgi:virginiamycin B lyase
LHQLFIAANSAGVAFAVFPHGVRSSPIASLVGDISSSSPNCTPVSDGRSCSFALDVRPGGPYDFLLSTFDKAPIGGTIPPGAVQLGAGVTTTTIAAGTANAIHMTVGGVVASTFVFVPAPDVFHAIASKSERLTIGALDADGNVIATDGYVDGYGNPLAITPAADSNAGTTVTFSPAQISAPQPNGVLLEYSALAATAVQLQNGFTATISANAGGATAGTFTLKVVKPERALTFSTDNQPLYVAVAQDRIFVTAPASNGFDYTFGATLVQARFPSAKPSGMAVDSEGNVWFTSFPTDALGHEVGTPSSVFLIANAVLLQPGTGPAGITNGPDGALWFTAAGSNAIGRVALTGGTPGTVTSYTLPTSNASPAGITTGPDQALWFAECNVGKIGRIPLAVTSPKGAQITEFTLPEGASATPVSIVAGSDGALWFTDTSHAHIGRITTNGTVTEFSIGGPANSIAAAPDGSLWFTEAANSEIGRILPATAAPGSPGVVEFTTVDSSSYPWGIAVDSEGSVYYTEFSANRVVKWQ